MVPCVVTGAAELTGVRDDDPCKNGYELGQDEDCAISTQTWDLKSSRTSDQVREVRGVILAQKVFVKRKMEGWCRKQRVRAAVREEKRPGTLRKERRDGAENMIKC